MKKKTQRNYISYNLVFFVSLGLILGGLIFKSQNHFSAGLYGIVLLLCDSVIKLLGWETI